VLLIVEVRKGQFHFLVHHLLVDRAVVDGTVERLSSSLVVNQTMVYEGGHVISTMPIRGLIRTHH
jgi:hypothetical protein